MKYIDIRPEDVRPGDWAFHKEGLDPREVTRVNHGWGEVHLFLLVAEAGPFPIENYTFRRGVVEP